MAAVNYVFGTKYCVRRLHEYEACNVNEIPIKILLTMAWHIRMRKEM